MVLCVDSLWSNWIMFRRYLLMLVEVAVVSLKLHTWMKSCGKKYPIPFSCMAYSTFHLSFVVIASTMFNDLFSHRSNFKFAICCCLYCLQNIKGKSRESVYTSNGGSLLQSTCVGTPIY